MVYSGLVDTITYIRAQVFFFFLVNVRAQVYAYAYFTFNACISCIDSQPYINGKKRRSSPTE